MESKLGNRITRVGVIVSVIALVAAAFIAGRTTKLQDVEVAIQQLRASQNDEKAKPAILALPGAPQVRYIFRADGGNSKYMAYFSLNVELETENCYREGLSGRREREHSKLYSQLKQLPGIVDVNIDNRYDIHLRKGDTFSWEELSPDLVAILAENLKDRIPGYHVVPMVKERL